MSEWFTADIFMVLLTLPELQNEFFCNCWNTFFWLSRMIMTRDPGFPIQGNTSTLQAIKSALRIPAAGTMAQANLYNFNIWGPARCHQHSTKAGKWKPAFPSHRMRFQSLHTESHQPTWSGLHLKFRLLSGSTAQGVASTSKQFRTNASLDLIPA